MIHEVEGDILLSGATAIAHGVAANDPMNQGLAEALHKNYPPCIKTFTTGAISSTPKPAARGSGVAQKALE